MKILVTKREEPAREYYNIHYEINITNDPNIDSIYAYSKVSMEEVIRDFEERIDSHIKYTNKQIVMLEQGLQKYRSMLNILNNLKKEKLEYELS